MEEVLLTNNFSKDYRPLNNGSFESTLYYNDKYVLKLIRKKLLSDDRKQIIKMLGSIKHEELVTPEFLVYDETKFLGNKNKRFLGYGMEYYKDFSTISNLYTNIYDKEISSFNQRKELMIKLSILMDYLYSIGFAYFDIHEDNILYKGSNIKLLDLDSGVFKGQNNYFSYEDALDISHKQHPLFTLSFLYNLTTTNFINTFKNNKNLKLLLEYLPKDLKELFKSTLEDANTPINITEALYQIDENIYNDSKDIIKKRLIT